MRLDQFLKLSRLIKQRTMAKQACDGGRVSLLGRKARAGGDVHVGDEIVLNLRDRFMRIRVLEVPKGNVSKVRARTLYDVLEERDITSF